MEACVLASAGMNIVWTAASLQTPKMLRKKGLRCLSRTRGRTSRTMGCGDVGAAAIIYADQSRGRAKMPRTSPVGFHARRDLATNVNQCGSRNVASPRRHTFLQVWGHHLWRVPPQEAQYQNPTYTSSGERRFLQPSRPRNQPGAECGRYTSSHINVAAWTSLARYPERGRR